MRPRWESGVWVIRLRRQLSGPHFLGYGVAFENNSRCRQPPLVSHFWAALGGKSCSSGGMSAVSADRGTVGPIIPTAGAWPAQNALVRKPSSHRGVNVTLVEHCCHDDRTCDRPEVSGAGRGHIRGVGHGGRTDTRRHDGQRIPEFVDQRRHSLQPAGHRDCDRVGLSVRRRSNSVERSIPSPPRWPKSPVCRASARLHSPSSPSRRTAPR